MATATPVGYDFTSQGTWSGIYGSDGYNVSGDSLSNPSYVTPSTTGTQFTFANPSADVRALQKASNPSLRIAAGWYSASSYVFDLNITSGTHRIGVYFWDADNSSRTDTVQVIDAGTLAVLDTRTVSGFFASPVWLFWDCSGHVQIKISNPGGPSPNCLANGIFFQPTTTTGAIVPWPVPAPPRIIAPVIGASGAKHQIVRAPNTISSAPSTISPAPVAQVIQGGVVNQPYSETITTSGGTAPYVYSVIGGALPTGTSLNSSTGVISGTPTATGTYTFTVKSLDAGGYSGQQAFSITIGAPQVSNYGYTA
jgi:hypothetical protein